MTSICRTVIAIVSAQSDNEAPSSGKLLFRGWNTALSRTPFTAIDPLHGAYLRHRQQLKEGRVRQHNVYIISLIFDRHKVKLTV